MDFEFIFLLSIILFFASMVHGSIGFGFPMIATPLVALFTDIQTAVIYTLIPNLLVNIMSLRSEGGVKEAIKKFWILVLFAVSGSAIGTMILIHFNSELFKLLLGVMILLYLMIEFVRVELKWVRQKPKFAQIIFGIGGGIVGGLTNAMAPVLIIYTIESKFSKKDVILASNICFLAGKIIQIIIFASAAAFTKEEVSISSFSIIFVAIALYFGIKLKKKINANLYKKIVKTILLIIALLLLEQSL